MSEYRTPHDRSFRRFQFNQRADSTPPKPSISRIPESPLAPVYYENIKSNPHPSDEISRVTQEIFFKTAREYFPDLPETEQLFSSISNIDPESLAAIHILSQEFKNRLYDKSLFALMAVTLLRTADNSYDIIDTFNLNVKSLFFEMDTFEESVGTPDHIPAISKLSTAGKNVFLSHVAAGLHLTLDSLLSERTAFVPPEKLKKTAVYIISAINSSNMDETLTMTTIKTFNEVSDLSSCAFRIGMKDNGHLFLTATGHEPPKPRGRRPRPDDMD